MAPPPPSSAVEACPYTHQPVLVEEAIAALAPRDGGLYVDATFGGGGYSRSLLAITGTQVVGLDRDPVAIAAGNRLTHDHPGRLRMIEGCFSKMANLLDDYGIHHIDGVVFDLGVSSMQLDDPARGFSFRHDGPLDMRMAQTGDTAADFVNHCKQKDLQTIIRTYGEEPMAHRIARAIVKARQTQSIRSTTELASIVRQATGQQNKASLDPATRTFQALRIQINDEMAELAGGLTAAETMLAPGGRLAVVSFHSLEDRQVKQFLRNRAGIRAHPSRHHPTLPADSSSPRPPSFRLPVKRALRPGNRELTQNRRARSARLRWAERTAAPAWLHEANTTRTDPSLSRRRPG